MTSQPFDLQARHFFDLHTLAFQKQVRADLFVWELLACMNEWLQTKKSFLIRCPVPQGVTFVNPHLVDIDESCVIESGSYIQGPCVLGASTHVRHGAYIRGNVVTGCHCIIGHTTEVKNSLLFDEAKAAHFAYLGDTILGARVNLGAGVKCANLRLDHAHIELHYKEHRYDTGLTKLGAILGDDCQVGCNSVLNPGCILGKGTLVWPLTTVTGVLPTTSIIKHSLPPDIYES